MIPHIGEFRCAACGSTRIRYDTKKEGYSISKGLLGAALLGTAGALAGTDGKKTGYYHCPDCGVTLSYTMPETTSLYIDKLLLDPEHNKDMLRFYKQQYPNIEWEEKAHNISTFDKRIREGNKNDMPKLFYAALRLKEEQDLDEEEEDFDELLEKIIKIPNMKNYTLSDMFSDAAQLERQGYATLRTDGKNLFIKFYGYEEDDIGTIDKNQADYARRAANRTQIDKIREELVTAILSKKNHLNASEICKEIKKSPREPDFFDKHTLNDYTWLYYSPSPTQVFKICSEGRLKGKYEVDIPDNIEYTNQLLKLRNYRFSIYEEKELPKKENQTDYARMRANNDKAQQHPKTMEDFVTSILSKKNHLTISNICDELEKLSCEPGFISDINTSNQRISAICNNGCLEGIYEVEIDKNRKYYSLYGTKERLEKEKEKEIRQYNEWAEKFNADLDKQIHTLNEERAVQLKIYEENSKKIFGKGAKAKRTAQKAIFDIDEKIKTLNATRKKLKK